MSHSIDTIIVGAGLAGACAALHLSRKEHVLVLESNDVAAGASSAAAGLVNPLMSQKARLVWRADAALEALHATLAQADATPLFQNNGILRPAADAGQAGIFRNVAHTRPQHAAWLPLRQAQARFPGLAMCEGALLVREGGATFVPDLVKVLLTAAQQRGAEVHTGRQVIDWTETKDGIIINVGPETDRIHARRLVLAMGYGYHRHPALLALNLHAVKGQTVRVALPEALQHISLPSLAGSGYVVPDGDTLVVGSSYERGFVDTAPSTAQTEQILAKAARMLPALQEATVLDATAGVRVTVPGTRLPMLGPLPGCTRTWIFTGLGSKGLLMAPLLARNLPAFFENPDLIPREVRVKKR